MNKDKLLPCPFCGEIPEIKFVPSDFITIGCCSSMSEGINSWWRSTLAEKADELEKARQRLIERWNTRDCLYHTAKLDMEEFVDMVEDEVGMGSGGWDMEDPERIIASVIKVFFKGVPVVKNECSHCNNKGYLEVGVKDGFPLKKEPCPKCIPKDKKEKVR